jgi:hypothetical protein
MPKYNGVVLLFSGVRSGKATNFRRLVNKTALWKAGANPSAVGYNFAVVHKDYDVSRTLTADSLCFQANHSDMRQR